MGITTDFIGRIDVHPPLNHAEQAYLTAFTQSRRHARTGGPYDVPPNPAAEASGLTAEVGGGDTIAPGQPSLWCGWVPSWGGGCIAHDGVEKFYSATLWLKYLIDHFLAPGGRARGSGLAYFDQFTFDHVLDGIVAASQRDSGELYLIRVQQNVVSRHTLVDSFGRQPQLGALAYEEVLDQFRADRVRRRPGTTESALPS